MLAWPAPIATATVSLLWSGTLQGLSRQPPLLVLTWGLLITAAAAAGGLLVLLLGLQSVFRRAPRLADAADTGTGSVEATEEADAEQANAELVVVIPAYNEAHNIGPCLSSVLASESPCRNWQVLVVDDGSSDATAALAQQLIETFRGDNRNNNSSQSGSDSAGPGMQHPKPRATLLAAGPRPSDERWVGKNWACCRAVESLSGTPSNRWLLFIDADVRLRPATLRRALHQAIADQADLLSLAPRLECGCLAEWMVQPIMANLLGLGFPIAAANDPANPTAFAAGPFMLFRASAYAAIGGHRQLAGEVVEDLALARRIKGSGYRLRWLLGLDAVDLRMYRDLAALWEGWSKNWYVGLGRRIDRALGAAAVVVLMFSGPWLLAPAALITLVLLPQGAGEIAPGIAPLLLAALALALLGIGLQLILRLWTRSQFQLPLRHWWLMGAGGLLVGALGPTSVWRTLSGRGWTWKGRSLA